jgi:long-chain fatty acid transport protein
MKRWSLALTIGVIGILLGFAGQASAQGFGVYEQGACTMGRGGAAVASPCADGTAVYFNPAGLSFEKRQIHLGGTLIGPTGDFTNVGTNAVSKLEKEWYPVPNVFFTTPLTSKVAAGIGVFAPYGLTAEWPETAEGRYLGYKSVVQGVYIQPTLAWKASDKLSFGIGLDITYLNVQLRQRVDLSVQPITGTTMTFANLGVKAGTDFADVNLTGHAWHAGAHVGVLYRATDRVSLGARVMLGQKIKVTNGKIETQQIATPYVLPIALAPTLPAGTPIDLLVKPQFATGGKLSNQNATAEIPMPLQAAAGLAYQVTPKVKLLADYQFVQWSKFATLPINGEFLQKTIIESYKDTHGLRLGTEISLGEKTVARIGLDFHSAAAPEQTVTPNLPEGVRQELALGLGRQLTPHMRLDVGYLYLKQPERAGRSLDGPNNGVYKFGANLLSAALSFAF